MLGGDQAAVQDTNDHHLANMQRNGTYSVVPRVPGGEITPDQLIALGTIAKDFGLYTKITGGQRIDLLGARLHDLPEIWRRVIDAGMESGQAYGKSLRTVKSCVGFDLVPLRRAGLGRNGDPARGALPRPALAAQDQDGRVGMHPRVRRGPEQGCRGHRHGERLEPLRRPATAGAARGTPTSSPPTSPTTQLITAIDRFLLFYVRTADRLQRTSTWLDALDGGIDHLRGVIFDDTLGIGDELDADMATHVDTYECEWKATLDDPERLAHFVEFVNAPDVHSEPGLDQRARPAGAGMSVDTSTHVGPSSCRLDELRVDRGVAALVDSVPVAVFRLADGSVAAIDHVEPFTGVPVLARGLVGSVG